MAGGRSARGIVEDIRRAVRGRVPVDPREAASIVRFLAELDRLAAPLDEAADPVHVTASAIVVGPRGVVLHRHKRLGLWLQPGGHVEAGGGRMECLTPRQAPEERAQKRSPEQAERAVSE